MLVAKNFGHKRKVQTQTNQIKLYPSINDKLQLLCLKSGYVMHPSVAQIYGNKFIIKDLRIRYNNTQVFWKGIVDLRHLKAPLSQLVDLGPNHIEVYPNQKQKAVAGKQLNKTCFVTFSKQPRINRKKLIKICEQSDCQLLSLDKQKNEFTVQIHHFSKYTFNAQAEDQKEQNQSNQQHQKQTIKDGNLVSQLKQKYLRQLQAQRLKKQKEVGIEGLNVPTQIVRKVSNIVPTLQIQRQVQQHNIDHGHSIDEERIKGSSLTYGVNANVDCSTSSPNIHYIHFNGLQVNNRDNLNMIFQILKDQNKINFYILSPNVKFQVKRVLALYLICFDITKCEFDFKKDGNKLKLDRIQKRPQNYYFLKYLKNWFEWVLNQDLSLTSKQKNQFVRNLALRRTQQQAQKMLKFKQIFDAQFLSSIQDEHYRCEQPSIKLCQQLREISVGNMQNFKNFPWIVKLAVFLWYYHSKQVSTTTDDEILDQPVKQCLGYNLQRHILRTFGEKKFQKQSLSNIPQNQLPLWWFISNMNTNKQKQIAKEKQNFRIYKEYRFNLLMQLTQIFGDSIVTLQLISRQKFLDENQVNRIFALFIRRFPNQTEKISDNAWNESQLDLIHQNNAHRYYASNKYIKALQQFAKCRTLSNNSQTILRQIVSKQEIICGFHVKTIQKIKNILQKIKSQSIKNQIMFLNTILGREQLKVNKVKQLIQLCYRIPQLKIRLRMLDLLFNAIIKSPNMIIQLKKDLSLQDYLTKHYIDPEYQLQLKFAKLQF